MADSTRRTAVPTMPVAPATETVLSNSEMDSLLEQLPTNVPMQFITYVVAGSAPEVVTLGESMPDCIVLSSTFRRKW